MSQSQSSEPTVPQGGFTVQSSKPLLSKGFQILLWCSGLLLIAGVVYGEVSIYQEVELLKSQVRVISEKQKETRSSPKNDMNKLSGELQRVKQEVALLKREQTSLQSAVEAVKGQVEVSEHKENKVVKVKDSQQPTESKGASTSDWQMYRNEAYGFELKYPKHWRKQAIFDPNTLLSLFHEVETADPSMKYRSDINVRIYDNSKKQTLKEFVEEQKEKYSSTYAHEKYSLQEKYVSFEGEIANWGMSRYYEKFIMRGDVIFNISYEWMSSNNNSLDEFKKILTTFKFLNVDQK